MPGNEEPKGPALDAGRNSDPAARPALIRRDLGPDGELASGRERGSAEFSWLGSPRLWRGMVTLFLVLMIVFSAIPLTIDFLGTPNKDYSLWYQVGVVIRQGMNIYPDPATGRLFPFMYPPSAAAILGFLSVLGKHATTLTLVLAHSAAWIGAIALSVWLATGSKGKGIRQHPLLAAAPSLCIIALIHNTYLLGQPNLTLLTLLLASFACLRLGREATAGVLVATAAAIKAFPILALGYFVYRRMWRASLATFVALMVWLLVVPLPFRSPAQAMADLAVWSRGMVFTYNANGIAQRPYRSFSFKNQSIMALAHRLLRDVPADGEKVLSEHLAARRQGQPVRGMLADGSIDLAAMLTAPAKTPRWEDQYEGVEAAMQQAWRVNIAALNFRAVTAITLAAMLALALYVVVVLPARRLRTDETDALEFALITLLIVMFSPLSFNYAFVWLIYPLTVALNLVLNKPARGSWRTLEIAWIASVFLIPGLAIAMPLYAQAYGNLFVPALLLVIGLGAKLWAMQKPATIDSQAYSPATQTLSQVSGYNSKHSLNSNC
jgi:alpha-1,2-mannosyltransferase